MALHPLAGKPAPRVHPRQRPAARLRLLHRRSPTPRTRASGWPSAPRATAARRCEAASTRPTSSPSARRSASTAARRASTGRSSSAWTPTRSPSPRSRTALEVFAANGVEVRDPGRAAATRPRPVISHAILDLQPRPRRAASPTASSSRRRTTRPTTAASSTTRPTAARPTPTSRRRSRTRANELLADGLRGVRRMPFAQALRAGDHAASTTSCGPTSPTWRNVIDMEAIAGAGAADRRRPAGRRGGRLLGADRRALRPRPRGRQPARSTRPSPS